MLRYSSTKINYDHYECASYNCRLAYCIVDSDAVRIQFPEKKILKWRLACKKFASKYVQQGWENCYWDVATKGSISLVGSSRARITLPTPAPANSSVEAGWAEWGTALDKAALTGWWQLLQRDLAEISDTNISDTASSGGDGYFCPTGGRLQHLRAAWTACFSWHVLGEAPPGIWCISFPEERLIGWLTAPLPQLVSKPHQYLPSLTS